MRRNGNRWVGHCFEAAAKLAMHLAPEVEGVEVVHANIQGRKSLKGKTIVHAWVEVEAIQYMPHFLMDGIRWVFDVTAGRECAFPAEVYYSVTKPTCGIGYSVEDTVLNMIKFKHFGPWDERINGRGVE